MNIRYRSRAALVALISFLGTFVLPGWSDNAGAATIELFGDQLITGSESLSGDTIILTGNLTVEGSLTVTGVTLKMNCTTSGQYHIEVKDGATLRATSSTVQAVNAGARYLFWVRPNATFELDQCVIRDCGMSSATYANLGLYIQSSQARITNSTLTSNIYGLFIDSGASPYIYRNNISQNEWSGVAVTGGGRPVIDHNTISGNVRNCGASAGGGILVVDASPFITNNTISANIDPRQSVTEGIWLQGSGYPNITDNRITGHKDTTNAFSWAILNVGPDSYIARNNITGNSDGIFARVGACTLESNHIHSNTFSETAGGYGIATMSSSTSRFDRVEGNRVGVILVANSNTYFYDMVIKDNTMSGIAGDGTGAPFGGNFFNCTVSGSRHDIHFANQEGGTSGGTCVIVNTTYDNSTVNITDQSAILSIRWYLHVRTVFESTGAVASEALVKVLDRRGGTAIMVLTGSDGWTNWLVLEERTQGATPEVNVTKAPYNVTASRSGVSNWTVLPFNRSYDFVFPLDDVPPWVRIDSPTNNELINKVNVAVEGMAEPGTWVSVNGLSARMGEAGNWSVSVPLPKEGPNTVTATCYDRGKNTAEHTITIFRDTIAPVINLSWPEEGFIVNQSTITVKGKVDDISGRTLVNDVEVPVGPDGSFAAPVPLSEGPNTIKIECLDAAGNTALVQVTGELDTMSPILQVSQPGDGYATNEPSVVVRGYTEEGCAVTINGNPVQMTRSNFTATVALVEGENTFVVTSRDAAGNVQSIVLRVIRDTIGPVLSIISPQNGTIFNTSLIEVRGTTERGALVKVNGAGVSFVGGTFVAEVVLTEEGENIITIEALDALKNEAVTTITVYLDTVPPELRITSPPDNFITKSSTIELRGRTEPGTTVTINDEEVEVDDHGVFIATLSLDSDGTHTFTIVAWDVAWNYAEDVVLTIFRDTSVDFNVTEPRNGLRVSRGNLTVRGVVEPGATVTINGNSVSVRSDGTFTSEVLLNKGPNTIVVSVRDRAGNTAQVELTVTRAAAAAPGGGLPGFEAIIAALSIALALALLRRRR
ncbi:MAG: right-handed parallel beta-helix repeat-containing protein [Thermoplasmatota archaeon]